MDPIGTFVPMGKPQLPPIQHSAPLFRENTLTKRPLSPIRFKLDQSRVTTDDVEMGRLESKGKLPPLEKPTKSSKGESKKKDGAKKTTKKKTKKKKKLLKYDKLKTDVETEPIEPKDNKDLLQRSLSTTATLDITDSSTGRRSSIVIDMNK